MHGGIFVCGPISRKDKDPSFSAKPLALTAPERGAGEFSRVVLGLERLPLHRPGVGIERGAQKNPQRRKRHSPAPRPARVIPDRPET